jgi:Tfp pilus assembly protein PilV
MTAMRTQRIILCDARRRGIALYELLISVAIIAILFGGSVSLSTQALHLSARAQRIAKATILAQNELEYWSSQPVEKIAALSEGTRPFQNPVASVPGNEVLKSSLAVTKVEDGMLELAATVEMPPAAGREIAVTVSTYLPTGGAK